MGDLAAEIEAMEADIHALDDALEWVKYFVLIFLISQF